MRTMVYVSFSAHNRYEEVLALLTRIDCERWLTGPGHVVGSLFGHRFDADDPKLAALRNTLRSYGIK